MNLIPLFLASLFFLSPAFSEELTECHLHLSGPTDLTAYFQPKDISGTPLGKNRWRLGHGSEGIVERVQSDQGVFVEKYFSSSMSSQMNFDLFNFLKSFEIKSFKLYNKMELSGPKHKYPWVEGVSLIKILENPKVPWSEKEKLWKIYEDKLVQLVNELTLKRPDLFFEINHLTYFDVIKERVSERPNLSFREINIPGIPNINQRITFRQRLMIGIFENEDQDDLEAQVLEPKPDNILVDLKNWEMTWIDPN